MRGSEPDGTILTWNPGAELLFGYPAGSRTYEVTRRRKDGSRVYVEVSVKVVRDADAVRLLVLHERDVTQIKYQREAQAPQARFRGVRFAT